MRIETIAMSIINNCQHTSTSTHINIHTHTHTHSHLHTYTPPHSHRELNPADTYLHQVGLTLLDANIQALRAANRLEALPTLEDIQRARAARQAKRRAAGERQLLEGEEEGKEERKEEGKEVSMFDGTGGGEVVKRRRKKLARK